jgi:hypothetical protein
MIRSYVSGQVEIADFEINLMDAFISYDMLTAKALHFVYLKPIVVPPSAETCSHRIHKVHTLSKVTQLPLGTSEPRFTYKRLRLASRLQKLDLPGQYRGRLREPGRNFTQVRGRPAKFRQSEFSTHTKK